MESFTKTRVAGAGRAVAPPGYTGEASGALGCGTAGRVGWTLFRRRRLITQSVGPRLSKLRICRGFFHRLQLFVARSICGSYRWCSHGAWLYVAARGAESVDHTALAAQDATAAEDDKGCHHIHGDARRKLLRFRQHQQEAAAHRLKKHNQARGTNVKEE